MYLGPAAMTLGRAVSRSNPLLLKIASYRRASVYGLLETLSGDAETAGPGFDDLRGEGRLGDRRKGWGCKRGGSGDDCGTLRDHFPLVSFCSS